MIEAVNNRGKNYVARFIQKSITCAAIEMIDDKAASKAALADAQRRMAELDVECKKIVRAVMKSKNTNLTIPSMTEIQLIELLGF